MYRTYCSLRGWLTATALLLAVGTVGAQAPAPAARSNPPKDAPPARSARRQVMTAQIGFEAQQQGYLAKVQGSSSQRVQWVKTPPPPSNQPSGLSVLLGSLFGGSDSSK